MRRLKEYLEEVYSCYNTPEFIRSDPLEIVREYDDPDEREVVALLTSALAYGRVASIKNSVRDLLDRLDGHPGAFLRDTSEAGIRDTCAGFRHRFTGEEKMGKLLTGIRAALGEYGGLQTCFQCHVSEDDPTLTGALARFVEELTQDRMGIAHLLPSPEGGSACKRLWLFLRWMVRDDCVDPNGWELDPSGLLIPLDAHMTRICRVLGMMDRSQADLKAALEATRSFRRICPDDPVKYDFALTRVAMCEGMEAIENWEQRVL